MATRFDQSTRVIKGKLMLASRVWIMSSGIFRHTSPCTYEYSLPLFLYREMQSLLYVLFLFIEVVESDWEVNLREMQSSVGSPLLSDWEVNLRCCI